MVDRALKRWHDVAIVAHTLLKAESLDVRYGPSRALFGVSLEISTGQVLALLGPNGSGKSTLARALSGLAPVTSGRITFEGRDISTTPAYRRHLAGITYIPEGRGIFPGLTVLDNLKMTARNARTRHDRDMAVDRAIELFPILGDRAKQLAGDLSGGEQQMLSLGRAIAIPPKLLIADEISLGLAPKVVSTVFQALEAVRLQGISVLMIEQYVHRALAMADTCIVLSHGRVGWAGAADEARGEVVDRYLGSAAR